MKRNRRPAHGNSLNELIHRQNLRLAELIEQQQSGDTTPLLAANIKQTEDRVDELKGRRERRRKELQQERNCTISDIQRLGCAWVLPFRSERRRPGQGRDRASAIVEQRAVGEIEHVPALRPDY